MHLTNLKSVALLVPHIIGVAKKLQAVPGYVRTPYPPPKKKNPIGLSCTVAHYSFMLCAIRFPTIFDWSFGWGLRTSNLGEENRRGQEWYRPKER